MSRKVYGQRLLTMGTKGVPSGVDSSKLTHDRVNTRVYVTSARLARPVRQTFRRFKPGGGIGRWEVSTEYQK